MEVALDDGVPCPEGDARALAVDVALSTDDGVGEFRPVAEALALGDALALTPRISDGDAVDVGDERAEDRGDELAEADALGQPDALERIVMETDSVGTSVRGGEGEDASEVETDSEAGALDETRPDGVEVEMADTALELEGSDEIVGIIVTDAAAGEALGRGLRDALGRGDAVPVPAVTLALRRGVADNAALAESDERRDVVCEELNNALPVPAS